MQGKRKEKSNREKKDGYAHDKWVDAKKARNAQYKQTFNPETKTFTRTLAS